MKRALIILMLLTVGCLADNISPTDTVTLVGRTILLDGNNSQPDSLRIITFFRGSAVCSTWYNSADADCFSASDALIVFDIFSDIDGTGGDGHYSVEVGAFGEELFTYWYYDFTIGGKTLTPAERQAIADTNEARLDLSSKTITLTTAERQAIEDTIANHASTYKATGFAVAGDPMTLTTAERGAIEDSVHANANDYKATGYAVAGDPMTLTTGERSAIADSTANREMKLTASERGSIEDSVHANKNDYKSTGFAVSGDPMTLTTAERQAVADTNEARLDLSGKTIGTATSVTNAVTLTTAERQAVADTNEARLDLSGKTIGTVTNVSDKTEYALTTAERQAVADTNEARLDLSGKTVGTATNITNVNDKTGYALTYGEKTAIADSVKNHVGIDSSRTAFGDSLRFALGDSCSGDGGSDTTAIKEMMNNNCWGWHYDILGDSGSFGDSTHWASYFQKVGGDSSLWIHPEDMWRNIDTSATIDTSDVGDWMVNNIGGGGDGAWNTSQRDSVLHAIRDSVFHYKVWHDSSLKELTALDEDNTDIDVNLSVNKGVWDVAYNSTFSYGSIGDSLFDPGPSFVSKIDSALASLGYDGSDDLHTKVDNLSLSGGGTEPETLIVLALEDSIAIQGARITVRTLDQSTVKVPGLTTDVNGKRILELDTDSFYVALTANNYVQATDTLVVLSGGGTDTLFLSEFDPGDPVEPDLCRVFGWVYDISGDSLSGIEVSVEIPRDYHPVKYSGIVITPFSKSTQTDSSGYWYIDLFPNTVLSDTTSNYLFTIKYHSGVIYRTEMAVPDSMSWQLE